MCNPKKTPESMDFNLTHEHGRGEGEHGRQRTGLYQIFLKPSTNSYHNTVTYLEN